MTPVSPPRGAQSLPGARASGGGRLRRWLVGVVFREASIARRLSGGEGRLGQRRAEVVEAFLAGCHAALEEPGGERLLRRLEGVAPGLRGFAFEGAGLGLTVCDLLTAGWSQHFRRFVSGPGQPHAYMMHVGAGFTLGRSPLPAGPLLRRLDPCFRWAVPDGCGFYEGLARAPLRVARRRPPRRLTGYARRAFDIGLGRSLWFSHDADVARIAATVAAFPQSRQPDLWSGLGVAASYTGWVERASVLRLREASGPYRPWLCQGAAFTAWARIRAANPTPESAIACQTLCDLPLEAAAEVTEAALQDLPETGPEPGFETWRQRVQRHFMAYGSGPAPLLQAAGQGR